MQGLYAWFMAHPNVAHASLYLAAAVAAAWFAFGILFHDRNE